LHDKNIMQFFILLLTDKNIYDKIAP